eukprot:7682775-Lingulodinium_polyedra.AAC.1
MFCNGRRVAARACCVWRERCRHVVCRWRAPSVRRAQYAVRGRRVVRRVPRGARAVPTTNSARSASAATLRSPRCAW